MLEVSPRYARFCDNFLSDAAVFRHRRDKYPVCYPVCYPYDCIHTYNHHVCYPHDYINADNDHIWADPACIPSLDGSDERPAEPVQLARK